MSDRNDKILEAWAMSTENAIMFCSECCNEQWNESECSLKQGHESLCDKGFSSCCQKHPISWQQ